VPMVLSGGSLKTAEIPAQETEPAGPSPSGLPALEEVERSHIQAALRQADGVVDGPKGAAKILNLHPNTLRHRMTKLGIRRSAHRRS
jgi:formate hydrogenlyase transcriptional activator